MTIRDAFTAAINSHRIGLKRYLMNRSSCVLLSFLFWFAKTALISEEIVVLLNKRAAGCFRNLYKYLLKAYQDECITYSLNIFVMDWILKIWDIQGITLKVFERILLTGKEILIIQDKFLAKQILLQVTECMQKHSLKKMKVNEKTGSSRTCIRYSRVTNIIYLQTLYITRLGGDCVCYIPFSLLRRPHQQNVALNVGYVRGYYRRIHCDSLAKICFWNS